MSSICILLLALSASVLRNPGFEGAQPVQGKVPGWKVSTSERVGVSIRTDRIEFREGKQSILLEAAHPAKVALAQEVFLPVGSLWRAMVWTKTENLTARIEGRAGGQIEIQTPAGNQGRSPSRSGSSPWEKQEVIFRVPSPGRISIALVGPWGETGKVWFDGVSLEEVPEQSVVDVHIHFQKLGRRAIDLKQGGQF